MRALVFVAAIAIPSASSAGPCAIRPLAAHPMTVANTVIPPGGGVMVSLSEGEWDGPIQSDLSKTGWKFVDGAKQVDPVIRVIAPGLAVYEPPAGKTAIKLGVGMRRFAFQRTADAKPLLPAPVATAIGYAGGNVPVGPRQSPVFTNRVKLEAARPNDAVAIIVFTVDKTPVATSWTTAFNHTGAKGELEVYRSPGRCETPVPGLVPVLPGTKVTVAWVDATGRIGAKSKELTVVAR